MHLIARNNRDTALIQHLIRKGLSPDARDKDGRTPLMYASASNDLPVVQLLARSANDLEARDKKGRTAFTWAVSQNRLEVVEFLLQKGAAVNTLDKKGNSLAFYLLQAHARDAEAFEAKLASLRRAGLQFDRTQHDGNTLLHLAAQDNDLALLKRLEEFNIDINTRNNEGYTALHLAAMSGKDAAILKYLVGRGADIAAKTDFEETAYDLAKENELFAQYQVSLNLLKPRKK